MIKWLGITARALRSLLRKQQQLALENPVLRRKLAVFEHLDKFPKLTKADLSGNRPVTTEAVKKFENDHPKCDIEWYRD